MTAEARTPYLSDCIMQDQPATLPGHPYREQPEWVVWLAIGLFLVALAYNVGKMKGWW